MKNRLFLAASAGALLQFLPATIQAAPSPARPYHLTTVRWIIATRDNLNVDDRYVSLIGHVTGRSGDEGYYFTDGTGTIRLDSEKFKLPIGAKIVVGGRIDQAYLDIGPLEVDVRTWHRYKAPSATTAKAKPAATHPTAAAPAPIPAPSPAPSPAAAATPAPVTATEPAPAAATAPSATPQTDATPTLAPPAESNTAPAAK